MQTEQIKSLLGSRKKIMIKIFLVFLVIYAAFSFVSSRWALAFTNPAHICLPYKVWLIKKTEKPGKGEYIAFVSKGGIPYDKGQTIRWVKILSGGEGDTVSVEDLKGQNVTTTVKVHDMPMTVPVQAVVKLQDGETGATKAFTALATDTKRRTVPLIASQIIPRGRYFVSSPAERSLDSRYWGLVNDNQVLGRAYPLW
jgi:conjugal transfer pilin signal peptidase TrbI